MPNGGTRGVGVDARLATSACLVRAAAPGRSARVSLRSRTTQTRPLAVLIQRVTCGTGEPELRRDPALRPLVRLGSGFNCHTDHAVVRRAAGALPALGRRPQRSPRPAVHLELLARQKETIQSRVIATTVRIPKRDRRLHCGREDYTGVQSDRFRYVNALFSSCSERHGPRATRCGARRPAKRLSPIRGLHPGAKASILCIGCLRQRSRGSWSRRAGKRSSASFSRTWRICPRLLVTQSRRSFGQCWQKAVLIRPRSQPRSPSSRRSRGSPAQPVPSRRRNARKLHDTARLSFAARHTR